MIADWQTNKIYFSEKIKRYSEVHRQIEDELKSVNAKCEYIDGTNDIWARDYMPIQVSDNKFIEYRYDPDYLQGIGKERREKKTYPDIVCSTLNLKTTKSDIILDGGNVVKSTNSIIVTDKIFKENKSHYSTKNSLIQELRRLFEVDKVVVIPWDTEDFCGHADGMVRFIDDDTVLIQDFYKYYNSEFQKKLYDSLSNNGLNWKKLSFDVENESEYSWAYINFMQTRDIILLPSISKEEEDIQALTQIKKLFPEYSKSDRIRQIHMIDIIKEGGALNCISWTKKE